MKVTQVNCTMHILVRTEWMHFECTNTTVQLCISYLGLAGLVAASVDKHFPIPVEHMELEDHCKRSDHTHRVKGSPRDTPYRRKAAEAILTEVRDQEGLGYKELGYMVPWEHQDLVVQEAHVGQEQHHGDHGEQADPMDSLDPVTREAERRKYTLRFSIFHHFKSIYLNTQSMSKRFDWL